MDVEPALEEIVNSKALEQNSDRLYDLFVMEGQVSEDLDSFSDDIRNLFRDQVAQGHQHSIAPRATCILPERNGEDDGHCN